jgi:hypothetical protein
MTISFLRLSPDIARIILAICFIGKVRWFFQRASARHLLDDNGVTNSKMISGWRCIGFAGKKRNG